MSFPMPAVARQPYDALRGRSRAVFHWRSNEQRLEALGSLENPPSGDEIVFTRAATATGLDVNGATATFPNHYPAWDWRNSLPALSLKDVSTPNILYHPWNRPWGELSGLLTFNQSGAIAAAGKGFWYIGDAAEAGVRLWIESDGTQYQISLHDGSSEVNSTLAATPADTNTAVLRWTLENTSGDLYRVQIHQDIAGAGETSASASSTLTITAWPTTVRHYLGTLGGQNGAAVELVADKIELGANLTVAQLNDVF